MKKPRSVSVVLLAVVLGLSLVSLKHDSIETSYDESVTLLYQEAPWFTGETSLLSSETSDGPCSFPFPSHCLSTINPPSAYRELITSLTILNRSWRC